MSVWSRRNKSGNESEYEDLLVFGYSSKLFANDETADNIAEERHMVACHGDALNRVDRYDCRLLLASIDNFTNDVKDEEECPTEAMEEHMCEEERYLDLYKDIELQKEKEEEARKRQKASIAFDYGTGIAKNDESGDDSEDEPFEAPHGIKFPVGLQLPPNMKLHHIIEKTASFVVAKGAQMEIVIKAKQRNNMEQFGFLDFDHQLYPFYKYIQKLIREKKYNPGVERKTKEKSSSQNMPNISTGSIKNSSLAAIAQQHGSDSDLSDDDSDCELHPSLLSSSNRAPSPEKIGTIGPRLKPMVDEKPTYTFTQSADISQRNDVYSSLFKNISHVTRQASGIPVEEKTETSALSKNTDFAEAQIYKSDNKPDSRIDDPDYRDWFQQFYQKPCPWIGPRPMLPPTPDLEPIVNSYAEYVAKKGSEFEQSLMGRPDLQLHFMDPNSPYYSYYHHKIRMHQWQISQEYMVPKVPSESLTSHFSQDSNSPGPSTMESSFSDGASMNRRQRRRLIESSKGFGDARVIQEPGVIDPIAWKTETSKIKSNDSSDLLKPVSFTLPTKSDNVKSVTNSSLGGETENLEFDPDVGDFAKQAAGNIEGPTSILGLEPPAPPSIPNNTQLDRKEKARIFMEKLLQEKRLKKQQEEEERLKLEMEAMKKAEQIAVAMKDSKNQSANKTGKESIPLKDITEERPSVSEIDQIINSRITCLLSESGFQEIKNNEEDDKKKRKKEKKRNRSRSPDSRKSHKERRRRRSRSRSRDYRRRSRSNSRGYRR